ncbi:MAG: 4-(cytidine 5'-diphospho)-2-C-methyl-D-erythritol kinase [Thermodesulfobacteriota bacterium]
MGVPQGRWLCPAKINLYLKILGRRQDGYHELVTVMQPLSLADELQVRPGRGLTLECRHPEAPPGADNLVWRAAQAFAAATGEDLQVHLHLVKNIPVAAGLGGGSSDAAATLLALNQRAGSPLDSAALNQLGAALGADVPFFLQPGPAVGRGVGTDLTPLDLPGFWYVLFNPGVALSTRWVYAQLDPETLARHGAPARDTWEAEHPEDWVANDLETVTLRRYPELGAALKKFARAGARAQGMSGSGPTLFGLFDEAAPARAAAARLRDQVSGWLAVARGLTRDDELAGWENQVWII